MKMDVNGTRNLCPPKIVDEKYEKRERTGRNGKRVVGKVHGTVGVGGGDKEVSGCGKEGNRRKTHGEEGSWGDTGGVGGEGRARG